MTFHTSFFVNLVCIEVSAFEVDEPLMPYKASRVFFSHNDQDKIISILILHIRRIPTICNTTIQSVESIPLM